MDRHPSERRPGSHLRNPWNQPARFHRHLRLQRLYSDEKPGCDRPIQPGSRGNFSQNSRWKAKSQGKCRFRTGDRYSHPVQPSFPTLPDSSCRRAIRKRNPTHSDRNRRDWHRVKRADGQTAYIHQSVARKGGNTVLSRKGEVTVTARPPTSEKPHPCRERFCNG